MNTTLRTVDNARILVVSLRNARPDVARCCAFEFEDVVCEVDDADLLAPMAHPAAFQNPLMRRVARTLERRTPITLSHRNAIVPARIERDYEVLFLMCQRASDVRVLESLVGWRERCKRVVCWIEELWVHTLDTPEILPPMRRYDHIFVGCRDTAAPLEAACGVPCTYGLPAVNVERFTPLPDPPERHIDCYWMGRRSARSHEALYERAQSSNFHYLYDTVPGQRGLYAPEQHRTLLASLIKRSRFFVANQAKLDTPQQTAGQQEVGLRFLEGVAGGAALIGAIPDCPTWHEHFNWPDAAIQVPWDSPDFPDVIEQFSREPERLAAIHHRNAIEALRRHDCAYRWRDVLHTLGLEPSPKLAAREARLHALADRAEVKAS